MIDEKDFMLDVAKSVIPRIKLDEKSKPIVEEAIDIIDGELNFMDSYNRTLDNILTLQDLASIHKVESSINYLTIVLVIGTAILIILELLAIFGLKRLIQLGKNYYILVFWCVFSFVLSLVFWGTRTILYSFPPLAMLAAIALFATVKWLNKSEASFNANNKTKASKKRIKKISKRSLKTTSISFIVYIPNG